VFTRAYLCVGPEKVWNFLCRFGMGTLIFNLSLIYNIYIFDLY